MKKLSLFFVFFLPIFGYAQVNESFLDGNFINNPIWSGTTSNFYVNGALQLQSKAITASTSYLFTSSEAFDNASWECWVKVNYLTSAYNYATIIIASDRNEISGGYNGYYIQIGGTNDEVSLFLQQGTSEPIKIITGASKRTDGKPIELRVKVTRDAKGKFTLYSKLPSESDFVLEGTAQNTAVKQSTYFGLSFTNTSATGSYYYFDDILVTGTKALDTDAPILTTSPLEETNKLTLNFSEAMDFSKAKFTIDLGIGSPVSQIISSDKKSVELTFSTKFEKGKVYKLQTSGLTDLAGNALLITENSIGIIEKIFVGDVIFNEVMFENPLKSFEYIEIYNTSNKLLDVSGLVFTTRKTDGTLNTGNVIPTGTELLPNGYLALCSNADTVRNFHVCPAESNIVTTSWSTLNNESSTLVLVNANKDTIYDELTYNVKWHNSWVKDPKGIALERTAPELPTQNSASWHSALPAGNYGTPGYRNSEFLDVQSPVWNSFVLQQPKKLALGFSEVMDFSNATFSVDQEMGKPVSKSISADKTSITLTFATDFEKGKIYCLQTTGLTDLAGNALNISQRNIGIAEPIAINDLKFNEVMFDNPDNSVEYIEIFNTSDKLLEVSGLVFTTRKTDGTLNTGNAFPAQTNILPKGYLALCSDAETVRNYHNCPPESNIVTTDWSTLNNESSTLVLTNSAKDTTYDELTYNVKWHHALVKNQKGVALERINPNLPTQDAASWHSAASEVNYGTPGYKNSQYRDINSQGLSEKIVWTDPESFSPDNDGVDDVCFIHYKTDTNGYVANVSILNSVGLKVIQLASNILLSSEGFLTWDGRTASGKNANVGIYVLYFELFNPENGAKKQIKMPIVVSSR